MLVSEGKTDKIQRSGGSIQMSFKSKSVPKRQIEHVASERDIFVGHRTGRSTQKPYNSDESQLFELNDEGEQ